MLNNNNATLGQSKNQTKPKLIHRALNLFVLVLYSKFELQRGMLKTSLPAEIKC